MIIIEILAIYNLVRHVDNDFTIDWDPVSSDNMEYIFDINIAAKVARNTHSFDSKWSSLTRLLDISKLYQLCS